MINKQNFLYSEGGGFTPVKANPEEIEFLIIDLFCGAGGTTTGFDKAKLNGKKCALVIACINHDPKAIKSHWLNHPEVVHFEEDIRTVELSPLVDILQKYRLLYPNAKVILWASLECTNFSKAKGGQPRDADSRTLADHLDRYITALNPDYIQIENVVEFMSWGPPNEMSIRLKIIHFMQLYGISDIKMRMLKVSELKVIQGFPADYHLFGNQSDQKKFIGNSVVPHVVCAWCEAMAGRVRELRRIAA